LFQSVVVVVVVVVVDDDDVYYGSVIECPMVWIHYFTFGVRRFVCVNFSLSDKIKVHEDRMSRVSQSTKNLTVIDEQLLLWGSRSSTRTRNIA
jgi:hypothetical protein